MLFTMWSTDEQDYIKMWLVCLFGKTWGSVVQDMFRALDARAVKRTLYEMDKSLITTEDFQCVKMPMEQYLSHELPKRLSYCIDSWKSECADALSILRFLAADDESLLVPLNVLATLCHQMQPFYLYISSTGYGKSGRIGSLFYACSDPFPDQNGFGDCLLGILSHIATLAPQVFVLDFGLQESDAFRYLNFKAEQTVYFIFHDSLLKSEFWTPFLRQYGPGLVPYVHQQWALYMQQMGTAYIHEWFSFIERVGLMNVNSEVDALSQSFSRSSLF